MKHDMQDIFENCPPLPTAPRRVPSWRQRLSAWWNRLGWDQTALPETLRPDVEEGHAAARPVRGRADWERRL